MLKSLLLRFLRGTIAAFISTLTLLLGYGVPLDYFSLIVSLIVGILTGFILCFDKGIRYRFFSQLKE